MIKQLVSIIFLALASVVYGGAPTAFNFAGATAITSLPYTINHPGQYYIANNCTYSGSTYGIVIEASEVTLNLNGFSLVASGPATAPDVGVGIIVWNQQDVTIEGPGDIVGFGAYGILVDGDGSAKEHNFNNSVYNVTFDKDLVGCVIVSGSIDVVEQCGFEGGSVGCYDIASVGGDRFQADNFQAQVASEAIGISIGLLSTPGKGTLVEDCLVADDQFGIYLQSGEDKIRFNSFNSCVTNRIGGVEEGNGDL